MYTNILKKEVSDNAKEFVGTSVGAMSFGRKRVFPKIFLEDMLGGCFNIIFLASRQMKGRPDIIICDSTRVYFCGDLLCPRVSVGIINVQVSSEAMFGKPSLEFSRYFERHGGEAISDATTNLISEQHGREVEGLGGAGGEGEWGKF